ncbi:MAG: cobalt-precorrin-4 C(11)-methyltransferase, partial [Hydrogenoanaerobacterium sp.]
LPELSERLIKGGYTAETPAAIVYKATWPDEKKVIGTVGQLAKMASDNDITKTALILVGGFLNGSYARSKLYDPSFTTEYRQGERGN